MLKKMDLLGSEENLQREMMNENKEEMENNMNENMKETKKLIKELQTIILKEVSKKDMEI